MNRKIAVSLQNSDLTNIHNLIQRKDSAASLKKYFSEVGSRNGMEQLDCFLGSNPGGGRIRKVAVALNKTESELRELSESLHCSTRRIARLLLLEAAVGASEDPLLQKGLSDRSALVRSDAARLVGAGSDRTRLYNQLVKLIREDPDSRVRRAAGKRLSQSFTDLYAIDFDGLPPLSRMLVLDALEGHTGIDEERAETVLKQNQATDKSEAAFRAARKLNEWGTLKRYFEAEKNHDTRNSEILDVSASAGVVDYLEQTPVPEHMETRARELAALAGREDLLVRLSDKAGKKNRNEAVRQSFGYTDTEALLNRLYGLLSNNIRDGRIKPLDKNAVLHEIETLSLENPDFKSAMESVVPIGYTGILGIPALMIAEKAVWKDWLPRAASLLSAEDPDLRAAAISCVAVLSVRKAPNILEPMLRDRVYRVSYQAAYSLARLNSGSARNSLVEALIHVDEAEPVIQALHDAGGTALGEIIAAHNQDIHTQCMKLILETGISGESLGVLLDAAGNGDSGVSDAVKKAAADAGYSAALSFLRSWKNIPDEQRKFLLEWILASDWPSYALRILSDNDDTQNSGIYRLIADLNREDRETLFSEHISGADGKLRRLARKLVTRRTILRKK